MKESEIAKEAIKKAKDRIESAEILFKAGKYSDSVSRSYYAVFDTIRGLLEIEKESTKTHRGTISKFNQLFIKTGKLDKRFGRMISGIEQLREEADYDSSVAISKQEAGSTLKDSKELFLEIEKLLKKIK